MTAIFETKIDLVVFMSTPSIHCTLGKPMRTGSKFHINLLSGCRQSFEDSVLVFGGSIAS